ncbi:lysosomal acid glucosylceramidase-like isoform X1 [Diorhabda sublineata]|uniref:lysosomal acid glucosylceramidase-like isoform X1 n=1 Tax=Diorhabda sublineata TaxID=1163346 RepID=UPI0024E053CE|nr:lysosomal acid glucosylceramidase-like isoform X1 [Diorhabda sublineata]
MFTLNRMIITKIERQTIIGFGGAFTDSAGFNIKSLGKNASDNIMKSYFSENGIGYTIGRVPIGMTDFSSKEYSYAETPDVNLTNFQLAPEDFEYKIPFIKQARELTGDNFKLFATAWTSPKWMKVIEKFTTIFGTLKPEMYQSWALYHLKFLQEYKKNNVSFWGITTGNEPSVGFTLFKIPSVAMTPSQMGKWISQYFGPTIRNSEFADIKIITFDDVTAMLPLWIVLMFFFYPGAKNYVDGIGIHWYYDKAMPKLVSLDGTHALYPNLFILGTEGTRGEKPFEKNVILGSWQRAEDYASHIIENCNYWVTGWVDWNLALDCDGGPTLSDGVDSPIIVNATAGEFLKQPTYYAMGHFSKFVTPGSKVIEVSYLDVFKQVAAFQRPDGGIVVVIANTRPFDDNIRIVDRNKNRGEVSLHVAAHSIVTLLYW